MSNDNGNGNGNGKNPKVHKRIPAAEGRRFTKDDQGELAVLVAYIVQQKGLASVEDVSDAIKKEFNSKVRKDLLKKTMEALRFKDFFAINFEGGVPNYKVKRIKFNCSVENLHVGRVITTLLDDPAGMLIKSQIEQELGTGATNDTSKGKSYPKGPFALYSIKVQLDQMWYGPYPLEGAPAMMELYEKSEVKPGQQPGGTPFHVFERTADGKAISIHVGCIRGFFRDHMNLIDRGPNSVSYFHFTTIEHVPSRLAINKIPVQRDKAGRSGEGTGAGFVWYETVMPGEVVEIQFMAPTVNFLTPAEMKKWLEFIFKFCGRSISPARGSQTGKCSLVGFEYELQFFTAAQEDKYKKDQAKEAQQQAEAS